MTKQIAFSPADILFPRDCNLYKWSVVACDQYTSEPEYWERVDTLVGDAPSTLRLILPESKLESENVEKEIQGIHDSMERYLKEERFGMLEHAMVYVERTLANGKIRRGLVGKMDLEQYSYEKGAQTPVRATEGTVLSRIPPRMRVRRDAPIELPHIMVLIDDPENTVIGPYADLRQRRKFNLEELYEFEMMENGGRISGWALKEEQQTSVNEALKKLADPARFEAFYHAVGRAPLIFAIGDGNHSLATAKACWDEIKQKVPEEKWMTHPARYALVELVNLHDESLEFEAIHRVVFDVDPEKLLNDFFQAFPGAHMGEGEGHQIGCVYGETQGVITVPNPTAQLEVGTLQGFLDTWMAEHGGRVDYIHGEDVVRRLAAQKGCIGFLLPPMAKGKLFPTVIFDGALPRKTFSMGEAHDKRFYLEARKIR